ncbi:PREDICTED: uncharacterized protein LOC101306105 isoform 1 [Fragaria vesca subsp. vesca]
MELAQARMKYFYDRKHSEREFNLDDWVYLKLQHYKQQFVKQQGWHKLSPWYFGSFQVIERVGKVAYKLRLPSTTKDSQCVSCVLTEEKAGRCSAYFAAVASNCGSSQSKVGTTGGFGLKNV